MSKARLIITAVVLEGRSQAQVARDYRVSQAWVSRLVARYRAEGDDAFEPHRYHGTGNPSAAPRDPEKSNGPNPDEGSVRPGCLATSHSALGRDRTCDLRFRKYGRVGLSGSP